MMRGPLMMVTFLDSPPACRAVLRAFEIKRYTTYFQKAVISEVAPPTEAPPPETVDLMPPHVVVSDATTE